MLRIKRWDVLFLFGSDFILTVKIVNIGVMGVIEVDYRNTTHSFTTTEK